MNFIIYISCAVTLAQCPLPGGQFVSDPMVAKDRHECLSKVADIALLLGYDIKNFHVECKRQR